MAKHKVTFLPMNVTVEVDIADTTVSVSDINSV